METRTLRLSLVAMLLLFGAGAAYAATPGIGIIKPLSGNAVSSNGIISPITTSASTSNASAVEVSVGRAFLQSKLGTQYYTEHIGYTDGIYYRNTNQTYLYFTYNIPFLNGTTTTGFVYGPVDYMLRIVLTFNGSMLADYFGPSQPYVISISPVDAAYIAKMNGVLNGTASITAAVSKGQASNALGGYSIVWAVTGGDLLKNTTNYFDRLYPGLYIDAQNGSVAGEYTYNPSIVTPVSLTTEATLGNYSFFSMTTSKEGGVIIVPQPVRQPAGTFNIGIAAIVLVLVIIISGLIYHGLSQRHRPQVRHTRAVQHTARRRRRR